MSNKIKQHPTTPLDVLEIAELSIGHDTAFRVDPRWWSRVVHTLKLYAAMVEDKKEGIPMLLWCPGCGARHIDQGKFEYHPHHTHACQKCGMVWRPAVVATVGVQFLPGYKDE